MKVTPVRTHKIIDQSNTIEKILEMYIKHLSEKSVIVISSKIVSICEGSVIDVSQVSKEELIQKEAQWYVPKKDNKYGTVISIKGNLLVASAGIDESNGNGKYILWPRDPFRTANRIRWMIEHVYDLRHIGVIITDTRNIPLRLGSSGVAIAHSGFIAIKNYRDTPDIFGKKLRVSKSNVSDALAVSGVLVMGEGDEQTPLAIIEDLPFVEFTNRDVSDEEISALQLTKEDDLFHQLLTHAPWIKGNSS